MVTLRRWEPFSDFRWMDDTMNRLWRNFFDPATTTPEGWTVPIDVLEHGANIVIHASLPGVLPEDISVTIEEGVLTIKAETRMDQESHDGSYLMRERRYGAFHRALRLPDSVDADKAQTSYEHGVLTLTFHKVEAKKARKLEVKVGGHAHAIEGEKAT